MWSAIYLGFSSAAQSCWTLCNLMDYCKPGFPVHHQLPEFTQTHVYQVGDVIAPSLPLLSHSPPTFNLFQHQELFQWVSSSHQVAEIFKFQFQYQSFQWIFTTHFLKDHRLDLLAVQGTLKSLLQHISKASILWSSAFYIVQLLYPYTTTWLLEKPLLWLDGPLLSK